MVTWQQRMETQVENLRIRVLLSGALGWCTDRGSQHRPAVFEYSRLDALAVARSGYLGEYAASHANSKDLKKQIAFADFLANPNAARAAGVQVQVDVKERQLGKHEFFARRAAGAEQLMRNGRYADTRAAELEWMMREAEIKEGFLRDDPNPRRRAAVRRTYRNLCNRDRK